MKTKELLGKRISKIRMDVKDYEYEGSIPLEISESNIELESGEVFEIPYRNSDDIDVDRRITKGQKNILQSNGFLSRVFNLNSENQKLINRNRENIEGKKITGIYQYDEYESNMNQIEDHILIEVESGFLIGEIVLAPKGTGHAGIWFFTSKEDLTKKFGGQFRKVY